MAKKLTITIGNDAKAVEIRDMIIDNFAHPPYEDTIEDPDWVYNPDNPDMPGRVPNPVSRDAFFKAHIVEIIKSQYMRAKRNLVQQVQLDAIGTEDLTID